MHSTVIDRITGEIYTSPSYLIIVDELLKFIGVDDYVQTTHLGEAELFPIHASKTHL